jgi:hypothetical protein
VAIYSCRHRGAIPLPALGTARDVGEEKGNGPGREIGHDPVPDVRPVVVRADCRMTDGQTNSDRLTISSSVLPPYTEHLGQERLVLHFTADDAVAIAAD